MNTPTRPEQDAAQAGFTIIELLVAMLLTLIVSFAIFTTLETFTSEASKQSSNISANDQVRRAMDRIVGDMRQSNSVQLVDATDLVYIVRDNPTQVRRERVCMDATRTLWRSSTISAAAPAVPSAGAACPSAGGVAISRVASGNSATDRLFTPDSAVAASVRTVAIAITLSAPRVGRSTLRSSAFLRRAAEAAPAVQPGNITATCNSTGPLLTLDSSVGPLQVSYSDVNGNPVANGTAGAGLQLNAAALGLTAGTSLKLVASVSNPATGAVTQVLKEIVCA